MNLGRVSYGQHKEVGWSRAKDWSVLVQRGDRLRDAGQFTTLDEAENFANECEAHGTATVVVPFHSVDWAGLLDGSITIQEYRTGKAA
jgi:hypothetical protein